MMGEGGPGSATVRRTLEVLAEGYIDVMINAERACKRTLSEEDDI